MLSSTGTGTGSFCMCALNSVVVSDDGEEPFRSPDRDARAPGGGDVGGFYPGGYYPDTGVVQMVQIHCQTSCLPTGVSNSTDRELDGEKKTCTSRRLKFTNIFCIYIS
jgi:hypothetical protein